MKKIAALFLAAAVMLSLTACGNGGTPRASEQPGGATAEPTGTMDKGKDKALPFEEITVVDNDQCTIKITGIDENNIWGYALETYMENKSSDTTYMYSVSNAAVNGVQTDPLFSVEVAPGKKSNEKISFYGDETLKSHGIDKFTDIEVSFRVSDANDWAAAAVVTETVHVYPYGQEEATTFVREAQDTDTVIVDNDQVSVIVTDYDPDGMFGYTVNLYLVNKTDKELMYSVDEASVNGFMIDPVWASSLAAGKVEFTSLSWSDDALAENGVTEVEQIEMRFQISDYENWTAGALFDETVNLQP